MSSLDSDGFSNKGAMCDTLKRLGSAGFQRHIDNVRDLDKIINRWACLTYFDICYKPVNVYLYLFS